MRLPAPDRWITAQIEGHRTHQPACLHPIHMSRLTGTDAPRKNRSLRAASLRPQCSNHQGIQPWRI